MFRDLACALALLASLGCTGSIIGGPPGADGGTSLGTGTGAVATSSKANLRFKRNLRLGNDYAQALGLTSAQLCNELGAYPCTTQVHVIPLGGVDPYGSGLYAPIPDTGVTTPIIVDRVALSACITRVESDLASPSAAVIFKGVTLDGAGKVPDLAAPELKTAFNLLYQRMLLRNMQEGEYAVLQQLDRDIEATGQPTPGKSWLELGCFSVLTTTEALFY